MTAFLILTLFSLPSLWFASKIQGSMRGFAFLSAAFFFLPICFGPFAVISHIQFEITSKFLFVFSWISAVAFFFFISFRLVASVCSVSRQVASALSFGLVSMGAGLLLSLIYSDYESGATPELFDKSYLWITWLLANISTFALVLAGFIVLSKRAKPVAFLFWLLQATLIYSSF